MISSHMRHHPCGLVPQVCRAPYVDAAATLARDKASASGALGLAAGTLFIVYREDKPCQVPN